MAADDGSFLAEKQLLNVELEVQFYNGLAPLSLRSAVGEVKDGDEVVAKIAHKIPGGSIVIDNIRDGWTAIVDPMEVLQTLMVYLEVKAELAGETGGDGA